MGLYSGREGHIIEMIFASDIRGLRLSEFRVILSLFERIFSLAFPKSNCQIKKLEFYVFDVAIDFNERL